MVNTRISQINGCAYCLDVPTRDVLAGGQPPQRLSILPAWRETELFTDRERAALTLAETVTTLSTPDLQARDYADARAHLTDEQLSAIVWMAIATNAFDRVSILSRHRVRPGTSDA